MVEPVSLTVGAVMAALVVKAAERTGEELGEAGASGIGRVVVWLRGRFEKAGDVEGVSALSAAVEVPDSPTRVGFLAGVLDARADADPDFRSQLERLIAEAEEAGVEVKQVTQTAVGNQNVQVADQSGTVTISYGVAGGQAPAGGK
jgi:hypothetical protein